MAQPISIAWKLVFVCLSMTNNMQRKSDKACWINIQYLTQFWWVSIKPYCILSLSLSLSFPFTFLSHYHSCRRVFQLFNKLSAFIQRLNFDSKHNLSSNFRLTCLPWRVCLMNFPSDKNNIERESGKKTIINISSKLQKK